MRKLIKAAILGLLVCYGTTTVAAQPIRFKTRHMTLSIDKAGQLYSLKDSKGKEYIPKGKATPLLSLSRDKKTEAPTAVTWDSQRNELSLTFASGAVAKVKAEEKGEYLRWQLCELSDVDRIDDVVWGPYNTNLSKYIGDIMSVVHDDRFAIGIMALDDNTTSGPPCDGEMAQSSYLIHTPDAKKFPIPDSLYEGQRFRIGGDGINDVAFFSHPEEYYRYMMGNGAKLEPSFGSSIALHSRNRRRPHTIFFPEFNDFPSVKAPRHLDLETVDEDPVGSAIAFYACPDRTALKVIEQIVKNEGLPYITRNGKWVKDPQTFCTDLAWWGRQDSLVSYAKQLGVYAVQDEGMGEYYVNPADRWAGKKIHIGGKQIPIGEYTQATNREGIDYGLHTLTTFLQPHCSDVSPIPSQQLCTVLRTQLTRNITPTDTSIRVESPGYLNEHGAWDNNAVNVLRIGEELITYEGITETFPYTLTGVKRGAYRTEATSHWTGEEVAKLQINCYSGFVPNLKLQDDYADYYAKWLIDGGMNYIDFDGFESFTYQGHGQYSFKRFLRRMFDRYTQLGGPYLRVMGSCVFEGNWHYMSVCNVGGGNHMFNPVTNQWGIEGKDIRYAYRSSYFPCTFGIQSLSPDWTVQTIENLQSKAVAWDATYMLGLSEQTVEKCPHKAELFKAFRTWEDARAAQIFTDDMKVEMQKPENRYHLERIDTRTWRLYKVKPSGKKSLWKVLKKY